MKKWCALIVMLVFLSGCSTLNNYLGEIVVHSNDEAEIGEHPSEFVINQQRNGILYGYEFIGVPNEYGILNVSITTNEPTDFYIYFWGEEGKYAQQDLSIVATHKETMEKVVTDKTVIKKQNGKLEIPKSEQPGLIPLNSNFNPKIVQKDPVAVGITELTFPTAGDWRIDIMKEDKLYASISLEVGSSEASLEKLYKKAK